MPEAPLEALARLEARLDYLRKNRPVNLADVEDAINTARDLVHRLEDAGAVVYAEADLGLFLRSATRAADLALKQAAIRLSEKALRREDNWGQEVRAYALACASRKNWTLVASLEGSAFERLDNAREAARLTLGRELWAGPGYPVSLTEREVAWAFLRFTEPASIARWLREERS